MRAAGKVNINFTHDTKQSAFVKPGVPFSAGSEKNKYHFSPFCIRWVTRKEVLL